MPEPRHATRQRSASHLPGAVQDLAAMQAGDVFVCILNQPMLTNAQGWQEIDMGRQRGCIFRVLVRAGTQVPTGLFAGVSDITFTTWTTRTDLQACLEAVDREIKAMP